MVSSGKDIAEKVLETQLMDCMQAHIFKAKRKWPFCLLSLGWERSDILSWMCITSSISFAVDEGSFKPDQTLLSIRQISEETLKIAHELGIVKTKEEADEEPESDDELEPFPAAPSAPKAIEWPLQKCDDL